MKAAVVHSFDAPPRYQDVEVPHAPAGHVTVQVLASSLHPRTRSGANGTHYTSDGKLPMVPGVDGVGCLDNGQRVYFLAADDDAGTMAQQCVADRAQCVPLPADVDAVHMAAATIPAISSWVALTARVRMQPGQRVLILGATGVAGRMAVQVAKKLGAGQVIAAGRANSGINDTRALGADTVVPLTGQEGDARAVVQAASEVDIVLDYLWGEVTQSVLPPLLKHRQDDQRPLNWIEIGAMAGDTVAVSSALLRKRNFYLLGSGQGSARLQDMLAVVPAIAKALVARELSVEVRQASLSEVSTLWSAPLAKAQRLVFIP